MNQIDPEDLIAIQVETQLQEALLHQEEHQDSKESKDSWNRIHRKTIEKKIRDEMYNSNNKEMRASTQKRLAPGSGQRLFPIFGDFGLSIFSINYALYFEFSYTIMRILSQLLFLGILLNILDSFMRSLIFPQVFPQDHDIEVFCQGFSQREYLICISNKTLIIFWQKQLVAAFYCVFAALIALRFQTNQRKREETRIISNPMLYDFNWTQDFFSVLIENIPQDATETELRAFFNNLEALKKIQGEVKEIILVQDISGCSDLLQKINNLEETDSQQPDNEKVIQDLKNELSQTQSQLPLHSGKAIVVFDSLRTRSVILQLFPHSKINFVESLLRGYNADTAFKDSYLTSSKLPEPQNLNFENLCYSKFKKYSRQTAAFTLSIILLIVTTIVAVRFEAFPALERLAESGIEKSQISKLESLTLPIVLMIIQALLDMAFQAVEKLTKRISKIHSEESWLNYSIYSSYFLYLFIQGIGMIFQWVNAANLAHNTIKVFCLKHLLIKLGGLFFCYRKTNHPEFNDCKGVYYTIRNFITSKVFGIDMTAKTFQFRFFKESSKIFPLVAMNFAFMANGSNGLSDDIPILPITIPITLITLYIGAICDKYRLVNQPEKSNFNSARFMLKLFKFFKADHFAFLFGAIVWMGSFAFFAFALSLHLYNSLKESPNIKAKFQEDIATLIIIPLIAIILMTTIYLFYLFVRPSPESLESKYDAYFEQNRSLVPYDLVSPHFTHTYKNPLTKDYASKEDKASLIL